MVLEGSCLRIAASSNTRLNYHCPVCLLSLFKISLIPSYMYQQQAELPESAGHIYYQSQVCDVQDGKQYVGRGSFCRLCSQHIKIDLL